MKTILLYHIYPINHWKAITKELFAHLPFQRIVVHISVPEGQAHVVDEVKAFLSAFPVDAFYSTPNSGHGEVDALKRLVAEEDLRAFHILTYMHCKGVTKPDNPHVAEWTRLLRYFIVDKLPLCKKAFRKGYVTYGINKSVPNQSDAGFKGCNFFYEGNFVSLNLRKVDVQKAVAEKLEETYYGLEGFWGKLCSFTKGYSAFDSRVNHYMSTLPKSIYTKALPRLKYKLVARWYGWRNKD